MMKTILLTGASSGLGYQIAWVLTQAGYHTVSLGKTACDQAAQHIYCDYTDQPSIDAAVQFIKKEYPIFEVLIHCAGVGDVERLDEIDYEKSRTMFDVNVVWPAYLTSGLMWLIKTNSADMVVIGATIWFKPAERLPIYSTTKRWLRWLIENRRAELKTTGSRVMWIHPGWLETASNVGPEGRETQIVQQTGKPLWKFMDPKDVAEFILYTLQAPKNIEFSEVIINRK